MKIGGTFLSVEEKQLFVNILFEFEGTITFDESEMGLLHESIEPPIEIHTVSHILWQQQNLQLLKAMRDAATEHVKQKLASSVLEFCQGPYRLQFFLVAKKKPGEWRFINDIQPVNIITIRESGLSPSVDEFSEKFVGYLISSPIDYFSRYFEIPLATSSRDLTGFLSELRLVCLTRLLMG